MPQIRKGPPRLHDTNSQKPPKLKHKNGNSKPQVEQNATDCFKLQEESNSYNTLLAACFTCPSAFLAPAMSAPTLMQFHMSRNYTTIPSATSSRISLSILCKRSETAAWPPKQPPTKFPTSNSCSERNRSHPPPNEFYPSHSGLPIGSRSPTLAASAKSKSDTGGAFLGTYDAGWL